MQIQSAFSSGLQGFQKAQGDANQAAANIATNISISSEYFSTGQESNTTTVNQKADAGDLPNVNQSIVDLKIAEFQAKASANVIQTADEMLGTLLDVRA
jgi:hypothetical protein